jgi:TPR repeat protein
MRLGHGGPVDYDGSAKWLLRAVASGDFDAWAHMGQLCAELKPQKQYDHMFAKLWFLSGAKNGSKLAQSIVDNWGLETKQLVEVLLKRHKKNRLDIEADSYTPSCGMLPRN